MTCPRLLLTAALAAAPGLAAAEATRVGPVPDELRERHKLDAFYQKHTDYKGYPILASAKVSDEGLLEARRLVAAVLAGRDDLLAEMLNDGCRFTVMAPDEMTTDVPEQRGMEPKEYWDWRARGLGGKITSCGEENLLRLPGDRYPRENILIHEFAHALLTYGACDMDPRFRLRLVRAYKKATAAGLWKGAYAATNADEYWAEGVQSYFDCNAPVENTADGVDSREELKAYDPELFAIIDEVFRNSAFRYSPPAGAGK